VSDGCLCVLLRIRLILFVCVGEVIRHVGIVTTCYSLMYLLMMKLTQLSAISDELCSDVLLVIYVDVVYVYLSRSQVFLSVFHLHRYLSSESASSSWEYSVYAPALRIPGRLF